MSLVLTPDELRDLTDLEQPAAQCRWLERNGWQFEKGAAGRPKVSRAYAEARLSGGEVTSTWQPDWSKV